MKLIAGLDGSGQRLLRRIENRISVRLLQMQADRNWRKRDATAADLARDGGDEVSDIVPGSEGEL